MTHNLCTRKKSNIDYCHSKKILITPRIYLNTIEQISRKKNKRADELANIALDS